MSIKVSLFLILLSAAGIFAQESGGIVLPEDPLKGHAIFERKGCVKCHAVYGYGGEIGPDLGRSKFYGSLLDMASIMWNHSPQMSQQMRRANVSRPEFSRDEMFQLLAYLYFLPYLGDVGNAENGKTLLTTKGCLSCHSLNNQHGKKSVDLGTLSRYASPLFMAQTMWNHLPIMAAVIKDSELQRPKLTGQEMVDISTFIRKTNPMAAREKMYMDPGNPQNGKKLFLEKDCATCHNKDKKSTAPDLNSSHLQHSVTEISALLWNHGLEMSQEMRRMGIAYPHFEGKEMADLIAYLYFLSSLDEKGDAKRGENIFAAKGCSSCHDVTGKNQLIGPGVKDFAQQLTPISMVQIMWNHAGNMQARMLELDLPWPQFEKGEMQHLYEYMKSDSAGND